MRHTPPPRGRVLLAALVAAVLASAALGCSSDSEETVPGTTQAPGTTRTAQPAIGTGAPVANVSMGSETVPAGGEVTVDLVVTPQEGVTVGALDIDVVYDPAVVRATACTPDGCNAAFGPDRVVFSMASLSGFSGTVGTVTFTSVGAAGAVSPLTVVLATCATVEAEIISCDSTDGSLTIGP